MRTILGLERLMGHDFLFRGKSIGLITNFSGIDGSWQKNNIALFQEAGYLVGKIFTPEHGLYGAEAGDAVKDGSLESRDSEQKDSRERRTIDIISLYGDKKRLSPEDLEGLDLLVFDIQDAGLRYYTYLYTMTYAMEAANHAGLPFVVLDRPNPLGAGRVTGPRLAPNLHSFVGDYELPMRHGLTLGEAALYFQEYAGLTLELHIVKMENYSPGMLYPETGLLWNIPSPALPTFDSTVCYSGGCLFEALNVSEGRGSVRPFQMYGAPFLDMELLYRELADTGVGAGEFAFRQRAFMPQNGKYAGEVCFGLEFQPLKPEGDFLPMALTLLKIICDCFPEKIVFRKETEGENAVHLTMLYGNEQIREYLSGGLAFAQLQESWREEDRTFEAAVRKLHLYD